MFHKLLLNFTWWVNRKDAEGKNVFQGGFLGLDNIGVFDRSAPLPTGGHIEQSDGTSWMGMYSLNMLAIALELAQEDPAYEDVASKFFEHFMYIAHAMHNLGGDGGISLWNEADGFYYDVLHADGRAPMPLRVRSMVGLIPLFAVETLEPEQVDRLPGFKRRMQWFVDNRPDLADHIVEAQRLDGKIRRLLSIVTQPQLPRVLRYMLDESEFLAPHGIRALSRYHRAHPYVLELDGTRAPRGLRAGGIVHAAVRRQLELARPHLVPGELSPHRVAAEVPLVPRRGPPGRVPHRLRPPDESLGRVGRPLASPLTHLPARHRRPPPSLRRRWSDSSATPTGATSSPSTNTSTAKPAPDWAPATRPAGPGWSPSSSPSPASNETSAARAAAERRRGAGPGSDDPFPCNRLGRIPPGRARHDGSRRYACRNVVARPRPRPPPALRP